MVKNYIILVIGLLVISIGVSMTIHVNEVGLEPWGAAFVGLSNYGFTIGFWVVVSHVLFISLTYLIDRHPPRPGTFINMVTVGPLIDLIVYLDPYPEINSWVWMYLFYILAVIIASFGIGVVIVSTVGAGSKTQFYVTIHNKTGIKLSRCKNAMEIVGLSIALATGGPIFIGTVLFIVISGIVVKNTVSLLRKIPGISH